jgi:integrase
MPCKAKFENKEVEIFTETDLKALIKAAGSQYRNGEIKYRNGWGIILMIYTGIRMGEALVWLRI